MRNLMMFFGSCGHTTVVELSDEDWEDCAYQYWRDPVTNIENLNRTRIGRDTRMVYVRPLWHGHGNCLACMQVTHAERK